MAEVAPSGGGGGGNRNFLLIVNGLDALLVLALLALDAIFVLPDLLSDGAQIANIVPTPTRIVIPNTPTRTAQPSPTLVVVAQNTLAPTDTETPEPLVTATAIPITATPIMITATPEAGATAAPSNGGQLPNTGLGEDLLMLFGGGFLLLGIIIVARRMRSA